MKKELFIPTLADRNRRATWKKKGSKDLLEVATEKVQEILRNFKEYKLAPDIESELKKYMEMIDKRTINDYVKVEGISSTGVSLPDGMEIKSDN
jgi:trimethylamine:corrinoid methyltransferase-like protein